MDQLKTAWRNPKIITFTLLGIAVTGLAVFLLIKQNEIPVQKFRIRGTCDVSFLPDTLKTELAPIIQSLYLPVKHIISHGSEILHLDSNDLYKFSPVTPYHLFSCSFEKFEYVKVWLYPDVYTSVYAGNYSGTDGNNDTSCVLRNNFTVEFVFDSSGSRHQMLWETRSNIRSKPDLREWDYKTTKANEIYNAQSSGNESPRGFWAFLTNNAYSDFDVKKFTCVTQLNFPMEITKYGDSLRYKIKILPTLKVSAPNDTISLEDIRITSVRLIKFEGFIQFEGEEKHEIFTSSINVDKMHNAQMNLDVHSGKLNVFLAGETDQVKVDGKNVMSNWGKKFSVDSPISIILIASVAGAIVASFWQVFLNFIRRITQKKKRYY